MDNSDDISIGYVLMVIGTILLVIGFIGLLFIGIAEAFSVSLPLGFIALTISGFVVGVLGHHMLES